MNGSQSQSGYQQQGYVVEPLLGMVLTLQSVARVETTTMIMEAWEEDRKRVDVTARWKGYTKSGQGKAEFQGKIYEGEVISRKCIQKNALVNLRRTKLKNFIDWQ